MGRHQADTAYAAGRADQARGELAIPEPVAVARALEAWGAERGWIGPDPYEGLNATRLAGLLRRSPIGRRVLIQLVKRSPLDLRRPLGIRPTPNAAALGPVASSYALADFLDETERVRRLRDTVASLAALRCSGFEEACWGYPFDVQTRVFFYPAGAPNTIATAFAGIGLLDAYERDGLEEALSLAVGACEFFLRHVPRTEAGRGAYFGYLAGDRTPIHNANMLVAGLLARVSRHTGRAELREAAGDALAYTVGLQRPDGSWPYGELPGLDWVDNFHTGYVLDGLMACLDAGLDEDAEAALGRGLAFYRSELFLPDGAPKYTPGSLYPIDVQCAAQGIQTFALACGRGREHRETAWKVCDYALARMRRRDGAFVFQRRRLWVNRIAHLRWAAAPMLLALTHLSRAEGPSP